MSIENHVTSLEVSNRLRELGVKHKSIFGWADVGYHSDVRPDDPWVIIGGTADHKPFDWNQGKYTTKFVAAFLASELGDMLPKTIDACELIFLKGNVWVTRYGGYGNGWINTEHSSNEADSRGLMLISLIENNLWRPE
jgi:hypothetical protein